MNQRRVLILAMLLGSLAWPTMATAAVPATLSYQGFLTDSVGNPVTGTWTVTFGLYSMPMGGSALFEETLNITTDKGLFSIYLGTPENPLPEGGFLSGQLFLEMIVETDDGPVALSPRQQVVSDPFALQAGNAARLGGEEAAAFVLLQQLPDLCITPEALPGVLEGLGIGSGGLDEAALAAWLLANGYNSCACYADNNVADYLAAAGYVTGSHFSGLYDDLIGPPDLSGFMTADDVANALSDLGAVLLADGSVALEGDLDFAGFQALNLAVHNADEAPAEPVAGQLWWDSANALLKIYNGEGWAGVGGGVAVDIACPECVDADDVAFTFAAADQKGGAALNVNCFQCINADEVSFAWAKGVLPGGDAEHALTADTATTALTAETAADLECPGCVGKGDIDPAALTADGVAFDDAGTQLGANTVQAAVEKLAAAGGSDANEGNGTVVSYEQQWGLPSYGKATEFVHLFNPTIPKVMAYLYASESTSFATSNNLVVAYSHAPNKFSVVTQGTAGQAAIEVSNPSIFNYGNHIMLHQSVGTGGNGTDAGKWELNQVIGINGNTVLLAKPLQNNYSSQGCAQGQAQAVIAASYNLLEVVNGGHIYPSEDFAGNETTGGIIYIRARKVVVKTGATIEANGRGYEAGDWYSCSNELEKGHSECSVCENNNLNGSTANCSGGGAGPHGCSSPAYGGSGGGGNKTAGGSGTGSQSGSGGTAKGDAQLQSLHFGGGGGVTYPYSGGRGGGIVVLGAETIIVEAGGTISANGNNGDGGSSNSNYAGAGGGAGGTVALFANQVINEGTISASGGKGGTGVKGNGGDGGDGWVEQLAPISGVVNESYPKGIEIWIDDKEITPLVGDPNVKGEPAFDIANQKWGKDGLTAWSTGPLDLSSVANWTLGEHKVELKETGGAGGELKLYLYVIYPFTKAAPPLNDSCAQPVMLDLSGPVTVTGTTEDTMGKIKATDAHSGPFCGGSGGPDVVYAFTLDDWRQMVVSVTSAHTPRIYIKRGNCAEGEVVACGEKSMDTGVLQPGTYYLFVDADGNLQKGDFTLNVVPAPPDAPANDTCAAPQQLIFQNNTSQVSGMTLFSNDNNSAACGGAGAPENVFQFTVPAGIASLDISVDADFAPAMYIAKEACNGAPIACVPAASYQMGWPGQGIYYLFLDGKVAGQKGLYTLTVTMNQ